MAPRYALAGSIAVCLVFWLLLAGCAATGATTKLTRVKDCSGKEYEMPVTTIIGEFPMADCAIIAAGAGGEPWQVAQFVLGGAVACAVRANSGAWGVVVLPPWAPAWMAAHEVLHLKGEQHPTLLPFVAMEC